MIAAAHAQWYELLIRQIIVFGGGVGLVLASYLIAISIRDAIRLHDRGFLHYAEVLLAIILITEPIIRLLLRIPFVRANFDAWEYTAGVLLMVHGLFGIARRHGPRLDRKRRARP